MKRLRFLIVGLLFGVSRCGAYSSVPIHKAIYPGDIQSDNIAKFRKYTFCSQDEKIVFSCNLKNNKTVSICGNPSYLRYSYGMLDKKPELIVTHMKNKNELFKSGTIMSISGSSSTDYISFTLNKNKYIIYTAIGMFGDPYGLKSRIDGVSVEKNEKQPKVYNFQCKQKTFFSSKGAYELFQSFNLTKDEDIEKNGL